jgi:hypothetical protein
VVLATARLKILASENRAVVELLATASSLVSELRNAVRFQLLVKIESVVRGWGIDTVSVHVPHWKADVQEWLYSCEYAEIGGEMHAPNAENGFKSNTMVLLFIKNLRQPSAVTSLKAPEEIATALKPSSATSVPAGSTEGDGNDDDDIADLGTLTIVDSEPVLAGADSRDPMSNLLHTLFKALHDEYPNDS